MMKSKLRKVRGKVKKERFVNGVYCINLNDDILVHVQTFLVGCGRSGRVNDRQFQHLPNRYKILVDQYNIPLSGMSLEPHGQGTNYITFEGACKLVLMLQDRGYDAGKLNRLIDEIEEAFE